MIITDVNTFSRIYPSKEDMSRTFTEVQNLGLKKKHDKTDQIIKFMCEI